jgi:hypothetical protein
MWADVGRHWWICADVDGRRRTLTPPLTCTNAQVDASRTTAKRKGSPAHNPEVAGSNPVPATNVSAGQRPFCSSEREGLRRRCTHFVRTGRRRTGADVGGHRRISRGSWRARCGAGHGRERHSRRFGAVLCSKLASAGIPSHSDCAGLQGNGPLRERRPPWVRLVLTPNAISWVAPWSVLCPAAIGVASLRGPRVAGATRRRESSRPLREPPTARDRGLQHKGAHVID